MGVELVLEETLDVKNTGEVMQYQSPKRTNLNIFGPSTLVELVQHQAALQPDASAFIYLADGVGAETHLTYKELDKKCRALGAWLQKHGVIGKRVLLLYPPGLDFIIAFFGCLYAGSVAVPVYPPRRNRSMLRIQAVSESAHASIALTTDAVLERVNTLIGDTPNLKNIPWLPTTNLEPGLEEEWTAPEINTDTMAFFQYTSGSTGTPKGVMLSHRNLLHNSMLIKTAFEHTRTSCGVFWLPSYHDMGLIGGLLQPIYCGRPNILMSPLSFLTRPYRWLAAISKYKGTTSGGPNFAYELCIRQVKEEMLDNLDLSSWKVAFNGAEPVQADTLERFAKKFERCGFRYESFYPCFGLAEGTLLVTGGMVAEKPVIRTFDADFLMKGKAIDALPGNKRVHRLVSSGRTIIDQRNAIVNPETCIECPEGTIGEIWTQSDSVAQGYWNAPESTEYTFNAHIADTGEGPFMRTGDLGVFVDGELFVTGRIKDLIIIRGVNLYPQDIELTAQKVDPILRPDSGGAFMLEENESQRLILVQEVERHFDVSCAPHLFEEIRKAIALEHEISVDAIMFVRAGTVPKTSSGKIQRHACRENYLNGTLTLIAAWTSDNTLPYAAQSIPTKKITESFTEDDNPLRCDLNTKKESWEYEGEPEMTSVFRVKEKSVDEEKKTSARLESSAGVVPLTSMSYDDTAMAVLQEVRRVGKDRTKNITLDTDITELGLDSLERMEILASLEDRFGGQFPEPVLPTLATAREVVDAVRKYLGGSASRLTADGNEKVFEVNDDSNDFAKFPEYIQLHDKLEMVARMKLNHFFDVQDGITGATTMIKGKKYHNFSSYNYTGASGHPEVTQAAIDAIKKYGTSVSASRIVSGEKPIHGQLEQEIADFLGTEATIILVGGHQTNETVVGHLMGADDLILYDALAHNSLVQGAILSGARRRPFPHGDWGAAEQILKQHRNQYHRVLIVLEGVYSMDGDFPDLPEFIRIRNKYKIMLMVDEAHSIGVLGDTGRGIGEHFHVDRKDVDIWMCTMSKTFGSCGGYISGRKELIEYLKYTVPGFMFSVGMPPAQVGAALGALHLLIREPERVKKLRDNSTYFKAMADRLGMNTGFSKNTGVVPVVIGNSMKCLQISHMLFEKGINVQPILHPAVEEKSARLRFFLSCDHSKEQIKFTLETLAKIMEEVMKN